MRARSVPDRSKTGVSRKVGGGNGPLVNTLNASKRPPDPLGDEPPADVFGPADVFAALRRAGMSFIALPAPPGSPGAVRKARGWPVAMQGRARLFRPRVSLLSLAETLGSRFGHGLHGLLRVSPPRLELIDGEVLEVIRQRDPAHRRGAAVLVVADASLAYDLDTKMRLYRHSGIANYWGVDVRDPACFFLLQQPEPDALLLTLRQRVEALVAELRQG